MQWLALPAGIALLALTMLDVFWTLVLPRAVEARFRLSRALTIALWRLLRAIGERLRSPERRERLLASAAPATIFVLLLSWAALAVLAYGLVLWSPPFANDIRGEPPTFGNALYFAGSSLFTLGFGDIVGEGESRWIAVAAAANGFGLLTLVIAYLPVLYGSFHRREVPVLLLTARAGAPPTGIELLRRAGAAWPHELPPLFAEWERWAADVTGTHVSYPLLALMRSHDRQTSWIASLAAVLDAASIVLANVADEETAHAARLLHATGVSTAGRLASSFALGGIPGAAERASFDAARAALSRADVPLRPPDEAWARVLELREAYEAKLNAVADLVAAPDTPWPRRTT